MTEQKPALFVLLMLVAGLVAACSGGASATTCGATLCISDVRFMSQEMQAGAGGYTLIFDLTTPDGRLDEAAPPAFNEPLTIVLANESGDRRYLSQTYPVESFTCQNATCRITLPGGDFMQQPPANAQLTITYYSDTFPLVLRPITSP